jgi:SAM-dependent methyltransferase
MRAQLQVSCPKARALRGTAEQLPLPDGSVDAVVVGSAFHWFDGERALVEFARVLRGPQILGLFGNTFDVSLPWVGRLRDLLRPATERSGHRWPDPAALQALWADVQEREFPQAQTLDRARLRDLALSRSNIAVLSAEQRETELARLGRLWDTDPELAGRTEVSLPWLTRARRCSGLVQPAAGLVRKT